MTTGSAAAPHGVLSTALPVAALLGSMASLCVGSSFAKSLFPALGAEGATAIRVTFAAVLLVCVFRPWRLRLGRADLKRVAAYGAVLGLMNLLFYKALETVPMGLTIAIEFIGPLAVALLASRRAADLVWVGLAVVGLGLLLPIWDGATSLDPLGVGYALAAAVCWALYIVFGQRVGYLPPGGAVALGMSVAAMVILPIGVAHAGTALLDPSLLALGLVVAVMSSAIPYSLEMVALRALPRRTFGVLLSLEPAIGSLAGLFILGELLSPAEWFAIACVVAASAGNTVGAHRAKAAAVQPTPV